MSATESGPELASDGMEQFLGTVGIELAAAASTAMGDRLGLYRSSLFISRKTVESHLASIYLKLDTNDRTKLAEALAPIAG